VECCRRKGGERRGKERRGRKKGRKGKVMMSDGWWNSRRKEKKQKKGAVCGAGAFSNHQSFHSMFREQKLSGEHCLYRNPV
jgi:hypothetical protein